MKKESKSKDIEKDKEGPSISYLDNLSGNLYRLQSAINITQQVVYNTDNKKLIKEAFRHLKKQTEFLDAEIK